MEDAAFSTIQRWTVQCFGTHAYEEARHAVRHADTCGTQSQPQRAGEHAHTHGTQRAHLLFACAQSLKARKLDDESAPASSSASASSAGSASSSSSSSSGVEFVESLSLMFGEMSLRSWISILYSCVQHNRGTDSEHRGAREQEAAWGA